ncbi:transporter substrate-binding domain-containing protein [Clostridium sp. JNZ X4-2]
MKKVKIITSLLLSLLIGVFSGCSSSNKASTNTSKKVKTIYVGTQNDYPPFCYNDNKGNLTGYDIDVIKEIDKKLDGYKFVFSPAAWDSIFLSLESNKTQVVADEIAKNPEREKKYLFSDQPYFTAESVIIVKKGRSDIKSLQDLKGKNVAASVGDSYTQLLEKYNKENGNKIILKYNDTGNSSDNLIDVQNGRVDAYVNDPVMTEATIKKQNLQVQIVGKPVQSDKIHLVFKKDKQGQELKTIIDPIIKQLKEDGTLAKLSKKWTGGEYIPK